MFVKVAIEHNYLTVYACHISAEGLQQHVLQPYYPGLDGIALATTPSTGCQVLDNSHDQQWLVIKKGDTHSC